MMQQQYTPNMNVEPANSLPALDTIAVMRRQEESPVYQTHDFLTGGDLIIDIDTECRSKMCAWCYQVADYCKFSRESVEIALSYLDRFMLSSTEALQHRHTYQLASMTCMYMAIKIHERQAMSPDVVSQLSQGTYSPQQVEQMERTILKALDWRMNPPTITSFARNLLSLANLQNKQTVELTMLQAEVATSAYHLIATPRSVIALAISLNALESLGTIKRSALRRMRLDMEASLGYYNHHDDVDAIRTFLYESLMAVQPKATVSTHTTTPVDHTNNNNKANDRRASWHESPRSVSDRNLKVVYNDR